MQIGSLSVIFLSVASTVSSHGHHMKRADTHITPHKSYFDYFKAFSSTSAAWGPVPEISHEASSILITCMDVRLRPEEALGIKAGQVHIMRDAGGRVRNLMPSIVVSQKLLKSAEITILHHTDCGMNLADSVIKGKIAALSSPKEKPLVSALVLDGFADLQQSLLDDYKLLKENPLINSNNVRLGIWDVHTNTITEVKVAGDISSSE